ncbi:MAG: RIP metalloprotease RseP [Legionella sp.]|nr:MAG: RIP metalloprotease RseP [Legionella sp.]PJD98083.1 MAG: RIP metalloprotease RseP [Legionella sp.]
MGLTLFYFFMALFFLVVVHEYGHFQVARWCGVKVLRFSFGFGKIIGRWQDKQGTEYVWSLFPLGGYVKMLDETEGPVEAAEQHQAFNNQSVLVRMMIVFAGPLFNFIFAFFAFWLVAVMGIRSLAPIIDDVQPQSVAASSGLQSKQELIELNGKKIASWRDFQYAMMPLLGSKEVLHLKVKSLQDGLVRQVAVPLTRWQLDEKNPDLLKSLGIEPFIPKIPPVVGEVVPDSPAADAGLELNDRLLSINGQPIDDWMFVVDFVKQHPATPVILKVQRFHKVHTIRLTIGQQDNEGKTEGFIGVRSQSIDWPPDLLRVQKQSPLAAVPIAANQTLEFSAATFKLIGRLISGQISLDTISGPVGIAQGAGDSGRSGLASYLFFLAIVSISLGVLNLLPIPLLDGGHLLYYTVELIRRKPLSEAAKSVGFYVGLAFIATMMIIALTNDISRLTHL